MPEAPGKQDSSEVTYVFSLIGGSLVKEGCLVTVFLLIKEEKVTLSKRNGRDIGKGL